jgi:hypothetical protein
MLAVLLTASMLAAGRWRVPVFIRASLPSGTAPQSRSRIAREIFALSQVLQSAFAKFRQSIRPADDFDFDSLANTFTMAHARLAEVELLVATLPADLLLRVVLQSELDRVRERTLAAENTKHRRSSEKSAAAVRSLLRELERIGRIAQSANQSAPHELRDNTGMPRSVTEAYAVLGINPDAAPALAKKLVDALRMSWHPDYARDEADRLQREGRMKQINTAWDMIKERRRAA